MNKSKTAISVLITILVIGLGLVGNLMIASATSFGLDGYGNCDNGNNNTCSSTITTTTASDVLLIVEGTQSGHTPLTPSDTSGLTWTLRSSVSDSAGYKLNTYYTITSASLSSDTVTCKFDSNARSSCIFFAVSGANTAAPFDTHSGVPCTNSGTSTSPACSISTSSSSDFIIGIAADGCDVAITANTGFTLIHSNNVCGPSMGAEYHITSSTQTNLSVGMTMASSQTWLSSVDAIVAASSTTSSTSSIISSTTSNSTSSTTTSTSSTCPLGLICTSSSSTSASSSSSTSTTSTTTTPTYTAYFTGVTSSDSAAIGNSGVRITIQAVKQTALVGGNYMAAWVDDYMPNGLWLQVGYTQINDSGTIYAVEQVWNISSNVMIADALGPTVSASGGYYVFTAQSINSSTWGFFFNGVQFGTYNFHANYVSTSTQSHAMFEQQTLASSPFGFNGFNFQSMQYFNGGAWHYVATAVSFGSTWQVQGKIQTSAFANDEFGVAQATALSPGTSIWNGIG